jgi:mannosyltransferase
MKRAAQSHAFNPSEMPTSTRWLQVSITGILLLAFFLRVFQLGSQSLWEDEIFSATQAVLPLGDLLAWTAGDIHPPAYYVIMSILARLGGWGSLQPGMVTDWLWRLPSAVCGVLAVAVTYRLGLTLMNRKTAVVAAGLLAISPVAIHYSQEARMHEMFLLAAVLSTWILSRLLAEPRQRWLWLAYGAATAWSLYSVYLGFAVLTAQAVWVLAAAIRQRKIALVVKWCLGCAVALALYTPWWPVLIGILEQKMATAPPDAATSLGTPLQFGLNFLRSLGPGADWSVGLYLGLWLLGVAALIRPRPEFAIFGATWMLVPAALAFKLNDPRAMHMRNAFLLPVFLLLAAYGLTWAADRLGRVVGDRSVQGILLGVLVAGAGAASLLHLSETYAIPKTDWRGAATYMETRTRAGDVIVTGALFDMRRYLDYYYDGPAELVTPALLVDTLPSRIPGMRASGSSVWALTRFTPEPMAAMQTVPFPGLVVSAPTMPVYEPDILTGAMISLMQQEAAAADDWAAEMRLQGLMEPDPNVSRAAAHLYLGDVFRAAGDVQAAVSAYETMVADDPDSAGGYVVLANAYHENGQGEAAAHAYAQAVARNRKWQGEAARQAEAYVEAGAWEQAVTAYRQIIIAEEE